VKVYTCEKQNACILVIKLINTVQQLHNHSLHLMRPSCDL